MAGIEKARENFKETRKRALISVCPVAFDLGVRNDGYDVYKLSSSYYIYRITPAAFIRAVRLRITEYHHLPRRLIPALCGLSLLSLES
jgi:hypothetical protein